MRILELKHYRNNELISVTYDLPNMLHQGGEEFILSVAFSTANGFSIPAAYYLGLDNRNTIQLTDTMASLQNEPTGNGYLRQPVSSASGFGIELVNSAYRATSVVVAFTASTGSFGPIQNLFLTDKLDNTGTLIATAPLDAPHTVAPGDTLSLRLGLSLQDISQ